MAENDSKRVAIITGGAGEGVGRGISDALAKAGWNLALVGMNQQKGTRVAEEISAECGTRVEFLSRDISLPEVPEQIVEEVVSRFGRLDGMVNNAGVGLVKEVALTTDEEFLRLFEIDFMAVFRFCRAVVPALQQSKGAVINIGSVHARGASQKYALYAAVKSGIEAFTRGFASDYGKDGIRANTIHPGLVESPQNRALLSNIAEDYDAWLADFTSTKQMVPRLVTARECGELTAFLLGDSGRSITGQAFVLDGGLTSMLWENG